MREVCPNMMLKAMLLVVALLFVLPGVVRAQSNYTPSELDTLVSNIALYPDQLLIHVLTASTYGNQIPAANAWSQAHKNLKGETLAEAMEQANLTYDPSVQALLPFPTVLAMMDKYKTWTDQLGDAVTTQKEDVMDAVQRMRQAAYDHGHLKSNEQVTVETGDNITINPVRTEYVYVPVYNPRVVYYVYADGYTRVTYGTGVWLGTRYGEWGWGTCWFDWGPRVIYVRNTRWYAHRPIPHHPRRYVPPPRPRPAPHSAPRIAPVPPKSSKAVAPAPRVAPAPQKKVAPVPQRVMHAPQNVAPVPQQSTAPQRVVPAPSSSRPNYDRDSEEQQRPRVYEPRQSDNSSRNSSQSRVAPTPSHSNGGFGKAVKRR
ncbi:MAG: DUF3300 domain-containing protein [Fibrobacter sp.]|nr:DUF3300 domain-containing protein [Fibrobacter sp.]